ncbi:MAG: molybdopterin molybdotransferase MoeA [Caulobacteraceae bacterium]|nr:molybdopterin molybdotransferase MoeA [Caulobacteraceae bacterium]
MNNLAVEEARARMLAGVVRLGVEVVGLEVAAGRVLAEPVTAVRDQPPFAASAMDGWAVRAADGAAPRRIVGESAAGAGHDGVLGAGETVRIFTGAPVPAGADAVLIQENAARDGDMMIPAQAAQAGAFVRPPGGDFQAGAALLAVGERLDPWRLALAAAAGRDRLTVARAPRVAILSTGDELAPAGGEAGPWQIFDSAGPALAALVRAWGGEPRRLATAGDDRAAIAERVRATAGDLVVTIGGASVGDHDLVKPALAELGLVQTVGGLRMRPGRPTWFGRLADGRPVLGLPGNPASALVCAELFLRPLLAAMQGGDPALRLRPARLAADLPAGGPREHWMRGRLVAGPGGPEVEAFPDQDSSLVTVFAQADVLLRRPIDAPPARAGDLIETLPLARS